jgi:hypothetical protein
MVVPFRFDLETLLYGQGQSCPALPWSFVSKITNAKHQITNKFQIPIFNDQTFQAETLFGFLNFGHCYLFDI